MVPFALYLVSAVAALLWVLLYRARQKYLRQDLPAPYEVDVQLPRGAALLSHNSVQVGTFKVTIPLEKLMRMAYQPEFAGKLLAVFREGIVEYWLPRGDGVFFSATDWVSPPWPKHAYIDTYWSFEGNRVHARAYLRNPEKLRFELFVSALAILVLLGVGLYMQFFRS